jgi:hypothetical protein
MAKEPAARLFCSKLHPTRTIEKDAKLDIYFFFAFLLTKPSKGQSASSHPFPVDDVFARHLPQIRPCRIIK